MSTIAVGQNENSENISNANLSFLASSPSSLLSALQDLRRSLAQEGQEIFSQWRSRLQLPGRDSAVEPNVGLDGRRA
jgi:hypothetical protein